MRFRKHSLLLQSLSPTISYSGLSTTRQSTSVQKLQLAFVIRLADARSSPQRQKFGPAPSTATVLWSTSSGLGQNPHHTEQPSAHATGRLQVPGRDLSDALPADAGIPGRIHTRLHQPRAGVQALHEMQICTAIIITAFEMHTRMYRVQHTLYHCIMQHAGSMQHEGSDLESDSPVL